MAKQIDYPRASLKAALQLADVVHSFAGSCSARLAAEKMGRAESGAFSAIIGSAVKHELIQSKSGKLSTTPLFREFKHAYTPEDAAFQLRKAALAPSMFLALYEKFKGQVLPIAHLDKVLIRELGAPEPFSSRLASYFVEAMKLSGLLDKDNLLSQGERSSSGDSKDSLEKEPTVTSVDRDELKVGRLKEMDQVVPSREVSHKSIERGTFTLDIRGPNFNVTLEVCEEDDLELVRATIRKIEKAVRAQSE